MVGRDPVILPKLQDPFNNPYKQFHSHRELLYKHKEQGNSQILGLNLKLPVALKLLDASQFPPSLKPPDVFPLPFPPRPQDVFPFPLNPRHPNVSPFLPSLRPPDDSQFPLLLRHHKVFPFSPRHPSQLQFLLHQV